MGRIPGDRLGGRRDNGVRVPQSRYGRPLPDLRKKYPLGRLGFGVGVDQGGDGIASAGSAVATEQNGRPVSEKAGDNTGYGNFSAGIDTTLALGVGGTTI